MTDTRRIREGYVVVAMAMPEDMATMLRVQALLHRQSIGDYVVSMMPREAMGGMLRKMPTTAAEPATKAPSKPRETTKATRATTASDEARAELWQALEAHRADSGWNDGHIAEQLGIATRNVSQWRKAGMVTSTKVEAVEKLLQGKA